jgi:hypothetical protein
LSPSEQGGADTAKTSRGEVVTELPQEPSELVGDLAGDELGTGSRSPFSEGRAPRRRSRRRRGGRSDESAAATEPSSEAEDRTPPPPPRPRTDESDFSPMPPVAAPEATPTEIAVGPQTAGRRPRRRARRTRRRGSGGADSGVEGGEGEASAGVGVAVSAEASSSD